MGYSGIGNPNQWSNSKPPVVNVNDARDPAKIWSIAQERSELRVLGGFPAPVSIEIQPTSTCNLRCSWCSYWERNDFDHGRRTTLPFEIIEDLAAYCYEAGVRGTYLSGGGEPCTYRPIAAAISILGDAGCEVALVTNGTLVTKVVLPVADRLSYLLVSLVSPTPDAYRLITQRDAFSSLMTMPATLKGTWGDRAPLLGGMYVLSSENYTDVARMIRFAADHEYDYCSFRLAHDFESRGVGLTANEFDELRAIVDAIPDEAVSLTNLRSVIERTALPTSIHATCATSDLGLYAIVAPDAEVYLCVPDIGDRQLSLGNLSSTSFDRLWGGSRHRQVLDELQQRYLRGGCSRECRGHGYNRSLAEDPPETATSVHLSFF